MEIDKVKLNNMGSKEYMSIETKDYVDDNKKEYDTISKEMKRIVNIIKYEIACNSAIYDELYKYSDMLEIVNKYVWTDRGSFVQCYSGEYKKDAEGNFIYDGYGRKIREREIVRAPALVGYAIKNVGDYTFTYSKKHYRKDENGNIVCDTFINNLAPGKTVAMTKEDAAIFASQHGINCRIKNGKFVITGNSIQSDYNKDIINCVYFVADPDYEDYINSVNFEIQVGVPEGTDEKGEKIYRVKDEYFDVFGGLEIENDNKKIW